MDKFSDLYSLLHTWNLSHLYDRLKDIEIYFIYYITYFIVFSLKLFIYRTRDYSRSSPHTQE